MSPPLPGRWGRAVRRSRGAAMCAAAVMSWLAVSGALGYGYVHGREAALARQRAARQADLADLDRQVALDRLRDETARTLQQLNAQRLKIARLNAERRRLAARIATPAPLAPAPQIAAAPPVPDAKPAPPSAAPKIAAVPIPAHRQSAPEPAVTRTAMTQTAMLPGAAKNFTSPGWVPDYFSNEAAPFRGIIKARAVAPRRAKPRKLRARRSRHRRTRS